jgi:hypothetical protein
MKLLRFQRKGTLQSQDFNTNGRPKYSPRMKDLRRSPLAVQQSDAFIAADLTGSRTARASFGRLSREKLIGVKLQIRSSSRFRTLSSFIATNWRNRTSRHMDDGP